MKLTQLLLLAFLTLTANLCLAQGTVRETENVNSILVGYDKHTSVQISKNDAKSLEFVKSHSSKCDIISYKLTLSSSGQKTELVIQGDSLPSAIMSKIKSGDKIAIDKVQAKCGKEPAKPIKGVTIEIK
jgi:hypothetical protein